MFVNRKHTAETLAKMSLAQKGNRNGLGHRHSLETRAKMSAAHKGKVFSDEHRAKISAAKTGAVGTMLGKHHKPETRTKISIAHKGMRYTQEQRARRSAASRGQWTGNLNPMKRPWVRAKNAAAQKGRQAGDKNPRWMGGISGLPYAWAFNVELKEEVRRRDGYRCQLCGVPQAECGRKLPVHHINYDKKDSDPLNLVTLCHSCHSRTNTRREYWTAFFQETQERDKRAGKKEAGRGERGGDSR